MCIPTQPWRGARGFGHPGRGGLQRTSRGAMRSVICRWICSTWWTPAPASTLMFIEPSTLASGSVAAPPPWFAPSTSAFATLVRLKRGM
eukprot:1343019-Prymnesium_polylepis.1